MASRAKIEEKNETVAERNLERQRIVYVLETLLRFEVVAVSKTDSKPAAAAVHYALTIVEVDGEEIAEVSFRNGDLLLRVRDLLLRALVRAMDRLRINPRRRFPIDLRLRRTCAERREGQGRKENEGESSSQQSIMFIVVTIRSMI